MPIENPGIAAEFVTLLTSHQRRLHRYISLFLPQSADAEEVLQETNAVLWAKASEFTLGSSFSSWSRTVARYKVIEFCRTNHRGRLLFDVDLLESVADELAFDEQLENARRDALLACLEKLPPRDRALIEGRYTLGEAVEQIAERLNRPVNSVYRSLERVRSLLLECITRTLAAEERS